MLEHQMGETLARLMRRVRLNGLPEATAGAVDREARTALARAYRAGELAGARAVQAKELAPLTARLEAQRLELAQLRGQAPRPTI